MYLVDGVIVGVFEMERLVSAGVEPLDGLVG